MEKLGASNIGEAADVVLRIDPNGMILSASAPACVFLCVEEPEAVGKLFWAFVVPDAREAVARAIAQARTDGASRVTARMRPKKRSPRTRRIIFRARPGDGAIEVTLNERFVSQQLSVVRTTPRVVAPVRANLRAAPISVPPELSPLADRLGGLLSCELRRSVDVVVGWADLLGHCFVTPDIQVRGIGAIARQAQKQHAYLREAVGHFDALFTPRSAPPGDVELEHDEPSGVTDVERVGE